MYNMGIYAKNPHSVASAVATSIFSKTPNEHQLSEIHK